MDTKVVAALIELISCLIICGTAYVVVGKIAALVTLVTGAKSPQVVVATPPAVQEAAVQEPAAVAEPEIRHQLPENTNRPPPPPKPKAKVYIGDKHKLIARGIVSGLSISEVCKKHDIREATGRCYMSALINVLGPRPSGVSSEEHIRANASKVAEL